MSLPTPPIQALSTHRISHRASSLSTRNISSPYSLAIPQRSHHRTHDRADTPTQYIDPPADLPKCARTPYLELPAVRKRPHTLNGGSAQTLKSYIGPNEAKRVGFEKEVGRKEGREGKMDDKVFALAVTFGLAVMLAIVIPLAAILPQKCIVPLPVKVLVPLFIDPIDHGWMRLEDM
jgi:hypothetical protein